MDERPQKWIIEPIHDGEDCRAYLLHLYIPITNSMLMVFEKIDGIEKANISTRYRFKFDIAACFGEEDVLERIEDWVISLIDESPSSETGGSDDAPGRLKELLREES